MDKRYPLRRSRMYTRIRAWDWCAWDRNCVVGEKLHDTTIQNDVEFENEGYI